tara:strand:+ start:17924 stop:18541 length:618 start_codon:yes stop_codon:yes gene_type:complete
VGKEKLTFYFDYVDPGSYLLDRLLDKVSVDRDHLALHPLEVCPPPKPPIDPTNPEWISYNTNIHQLARESGLDWHLPTSYPWTRKAHELSLHARDKGLEEFVHKEIFKAHFQQHLDIGRIDVLVSIASKSGLDPSETKATLDVDKYSKKIHLLGLEAIHKGFKRAPLLWAEANSLEGPANICELRKFLKSSGIDVSNDPTSHPKS